jgi:protein TonB
VRPGALPEVAATIGRTWYPQPSPPPPSVETRVRPVVRPPRANPHSTAPAVAPIQLPGPAPTLDEPEGPVPPEGPAPCLHGCDASSGAGGSGDGTTALGSTPSDSGGVPTPIRIHEGIKPPLRVVYVAPRYPALAITARIGATIVLDCTIAADGRVTDVRVIGGHPLFTEAAVEAVRQWRYMPTLLNGVPVPVLMTVTVRFVAKG